MPTIAQTIEKVNDFTELQPGWHFGEGVTPEERIREKAIQFLRYGEYMGITRANAFPGVDGQIQITFYYEDSMLELNIEADGTVTIAEDEGREQIYFKEGASEIDARTKLREFSEKIWNSSESSIESITIPSAEIFPVRRSSLQAIKVSRLLRNLVRLTQATQSASTFQDFIRTWSETLRSTGKYQTIRYPKAVGSSSKPAQWVTIATSISTAGIEIKRDRHSSPYS